VEHVIQAKVVVAGSAKGELLISDEPLSFWGGYDHKSGEIIDRRHPLSGQCAAGKIFAVPFSRGSSTTTAVLLEAVRAGTAPAAIITTGTDAFFALASIVAEEMYHAPIPIAVVPKAQFERLRSGDWLELDEGGRIVVEGK
jgi:predicted aconitase with swiveling domain